MADKILLIVIDQFRADCVQGRLATAAPLPNLLALKAEATNFRQHYTVTTPCGPSRASLLTGLYAMNHRSVRNGTPLAAHHQTLGQHMRKGGYEPLLFGYTDVSTDPQGLHPNDPDLRNYEGLAPGFSEIVRQRFEKAGSWVGYLKTRGYQIPENYWDLYRPVIDQTTASTRFPDGSPIRSPALYEADDSDTAYLTDRTLEELSVRETENWFAMLTYIKPHPPLVAPAPFNTLYPTDSIPPPLRGPSLDQLRQSHPFFDACFSSSSNFGLYHGFDGNVTGLTEFEIAELRAVYAGLALEVDQHIGRVIAYLKDSGQYDETLIIVTADHGEMLGDHFLWGKSTPMEAALHIPLLIRDPRVPASFGREVSAFTESVDVAPTLVDWLNTRPANKSLRDFDGQSLLPLLSDAAPRNWRQSVFAEAEMGEPDEPTDIQKTLGLETEQANYAVLRSEHYKYVHFNGGVKPLLYDLYKDPGECHNLGSEKTSTGQLMRCAAAMLDHRMTHANRSLSSKKLTADGLFDGT